MPMNCLMPHCRHRRDTFPCTLHLFPHQEPWRSQWIQACRRVHKEADGTLVPWAGPGAQASICSCHFSSPAVSNRGRKRTNSNYSVPDINLPDRDYVVYKGFRSMKRKKMENESDNESEDDDDVQSGSRTSSARATPYDDAILTAMEINGTDPPANEPTSPRSLDSSATEHAPKKARKSMKSTARKSTRADSTKSNDEEPFFSHDFLWDLGHIVYTPPAPPPELALQISPHRCQACGSTFVLESSLNNHLSRTVLDITYVCRPCPQILKFENRCAFLNHCLAHEPLADREQLCRRAVVRTAKTMPSGKDIDLSIDLMSTSIAEIDGGRRDSVESQQHASNESSSLSESMNSTWKRESLGENDQSTNHVSEMDTTDPLPMESTPKEDKEKMGTTPTNVKTHTNESNNNNNNNSTKIPNEDPSMKCPECRISFVGYNGMVAHFGSHKKPNPKLVCPICSMVMPSKCCFAAHLRTHTRSQPCVCFICAYAVEPTVFDRHLNEKCLAYCRRLVADCAVCTTTMRSLRDYLIHLESEHVQSLYKCSSCTIACTTYEFLEAHMNTEHGLPPPSSKNAMILKCSLCVGLFQTKNLLDEHMRVSHYSDLIANGSFLFVCQICKDGPSFALKKDLFTHYRQEHKERYRPFLCNECDFDGEKGSRLALHIHENHESSTHGMKIVDEELPAVNVCPICQHECLDTEEIYEHRSSHETSDDKFWCFVCREIFSSKQALTQHERICTRRTDENGELVAYLCQFCSKTFVTKDELEDHVKKAHEINRFPCGLCGLTYNNEDDLVSHTTEMHSREKRKLPFVCQVCEKRNIEKAFTSAHWLKRHIAVVHKGRSAQVIPDEIPEPEVKVKTPEAEEVKRLKRHGESTFTCATCHYQTEDRPSFLQHIETHKTDGIQCSECGLHFLVESSIKKHLLMVHKIRDIDSFMSSILPDASKNGFKLDEKTLNCSVCEKHFDDLNALKIHMRSHGMAFITMKRTERSPSKHTAT